MRNQVAMGVQNKDFGAVSQKDLFLIKKKWLRQMLFFSISDHYRHAMSFHRENHLSLPS